MKRIAIFAAFAAVVLVLAAAMVGAAASVPASVKVRVLNVSVYGEKNLTDAKGIAEAATMSVAQDPRMFPPIESLLVTSGNDSAKYAPDVALPAGGLKVAGSASEAEKINFTSLPNPDMPGKFDIAVVSPDGTVKYINEQVSIDYVNRAITTVTPFAVKDGDTVLVFVKDVDKMYFGDEHERKYNNDDGHQGRGGRQG